MIDQQTSNEATDNQKPESLAMSAGPDCWAADVPVTNDWLLEIGFSPTSESGVFRKPIAKAFNGDPQWIEADLNEYPTLALCRTCDVYEEKNMPGDRVFFEPVTRNKLLAVMSVFGV